MAKGAYVYILANNPRGTLYIGVTSDLIKRIQEHRSELRSGFTARYNVKRLVYFEVLDEIAEAIAREKQLKRWHRPWKIRLIEETNRDWQDLALTLGFEPLSE
jgi:putative endonuclease